MQIVAENRVAEDKETEEDEVNPTDFVRTAPVHMPANVVFGSIPASDTSCALPTRPIVSEQGQILEQKTLQTPALRGPREWPLLLLRSLSKENNGWSAGGSVRNVFCLDSWL